MSSRELGIILNDILILPSFGNSNSCELNFVKKASLDIDSNAVSAHQLIINDSPKLLVEKVSLSNSPEDKQYLFKGNDFLQLFKNIDDDNLSIKKLIQNKANFLVHSTQYFPLKLK